jgi:hypothetical protein
LAGLPFLPFAPFAPFGPPGPAGPVAPGGPGGPGGPVTDTVTVWLLVVELVVGVLLVVLLLLVLLLLVLLLLLVGQSTSSLSLSESQHGDFILASSHFSSVGHLSRRLPSIDTWCPSGHMHFCGV